MNLAEKDTLLADQDIDVSVIIPVKNEAGNIPQLAAEIDAVMNQLDWEWECLWIDDGSTDESLSALESVVQENPHHRCLSFAQNAGQSAALWAGFRESGGRFLITLDGDGQNDPADIPRLMTALLRDSADMVNGYRKRRKDNWVRKLSSKVANGFRNLTTGNTVRDTGCSTRALRRECVEHLPNFKGMHRFLPTLVRMGGFRITEVPVNHRPRAHGKTKYSINNRLWVGLYDIFGVMWLQQRAFRYEIRRRL